MSINSMAQYNGSTNWTRNTNYFLAENRYDTTGTSMATSAASGYDGTGGQGVTLISNSMSISPAAGIWNLGTP
jgi:hypothetical protein